MIEYTDDQPERIAQPVDVPLDRGAAPSNPVVPLPDPSRLPIELRTATSWMVWRGEWRWNTSNNNWRLAKIPCDRVTGRNMDCNERTGWSVVQAALDAAEHLRRQYGDCFGVGLVFHEGLGIFCVDLDGDLAGGIESERLRWLRAQHPTGIEISVSGIGAHAFYHGSVVGKRVCDWRGSRAEIFGTSGFIAVTGHWGATEGTPLADGAGILADIYASPSNVIVPRPAPVKIWPAPLPSSLPAEIFIPRLRIANQPSVNQWSAHCPAHRDHNPSLSVTERDDHALLIYCHAGCDPKAVLAAVGLELKNLYPSGLARFVRIETGRRISNTRGGIYVNLAPRTMPRIEAVPAQTVEHFTAIAHAAQQCAYRLGELAEQTGLPTWALATIGVGETGSGWLFPEHDGCGSIVGISVRQNDGGKRSLPGSSRGLTLPSCIRGSDVALPDGPLYIAEGATDTAALLSQNHLAIGRPSAILSAAVRNYLADLLNNFPRLHVGRELVVVGDNDANGAGRHGAEQASLFLQRLLNRPVYVVLPAPSFKDVRAQIIAGFWNLPLEWLAPVE